MSGLIPVGLYMLGSSAKQNIKVLPTPIVAVNTTPLPTSSVSAVLKVSVTGTGDKGENNSMIDSVTKLDRSKLDIAVLNGSGEAGAARGVSDFLRSLGYKVVKIDNADSYNYRNLTVIVKRSSSNYAGLIKRDLEGNPTYASVSASVSDNISSEAVVIVGE